MARTWSRIPIILAMLVVPDCGETSDSLYWFHRVSILGFRVSDWNTFAGKEENVGIKPTKAVNWNKIFTKVLAKVTRKSSQLEFLRVNAANQNNLTCLRLAWSLLVCWQPGWWVGILCSLQMDQWRQGVWWRKCWLLKHLNCHLIFLRRRCWRQSCWIR